MRRVILPICLMLGACVPNLDSDLPTRAAPPETGSFAEMKRFSAPRAVPPQWSNRDIARDFLDLTFRMESGRVLQHMSRFEAPISLRLTGAAPPTLMSDLNRVVHRLRSEAGLNIATTASADASITIQAVSRADIRRHLPQAACFVVPNISSLSEYRAAKRRGLTQWSTLKVRQKLAVFVPNDSPPQEIRDCLHEELAQALGPLNDLYRLSDSVFNDDNVHTVLTGFDMLVLRAYYAPELRSGMTRQQVAARLPAVLSRLNPAGDRIQSRYLRETPRGWIDAIQTALGPGAGLAQRQQAAKRALNIATGLGWNDHRRAFSHYAIGRLTQYTDPKTAAAHFQLADTIYAQNPNTELHRSYTAAQLAAYEIAQGHGETALRIINPRIAAAERNENAALLATLMMLRAEALELSGRVAEARQVRLDSLGWARYGFGAEWAVRAKLHEMAALNPLKN